MANYSFDDNGNLKQPASKSVSEINEYIKWLIDGEMQLQDIYVVGELSNFKKHTTGHCYFSSFIGGLSGNRGYCKQPCRKKYTLTVNGQAKRQGLHCTGKR